MLPDSLPPDLANFVQHEIELGKYPNADDVVCDALRLLKQQQEMLNQLKADVREGLDELDRGEGLPFDAERIRVEVARRLAASVE